MIEIIKNCDINNNDETLFWKVFHNKFLFRNIINIIKDTEWVIYKNQDQIHSNNRISFNHLNTLEILVKTKNFQLLKYKLQSPNEHVYISKDGIIELFKVRVGEKGDGGELQVVLKEIMDILLSPDKRNQFEICNLVEVAIKINNEFILDILINEPYKLPVYPKSLEYSSLNSNLSTFKKLLKIQPIITKSFKDNSIKDASNNKHYFKEMLEFILGDANLYSNEYTGNPKDKSNVQVTLPIFSQLNLKSQNKLFDLDMITAKPRGNYKFEFPAADDQQLSPEEVFLKYKLYYKFQCERGLSDTPHMIKEIDKLDQSSLTGFDILSFKLKNLESEILKHYPTAIKCRVTNITGKGINSSRVVKDLEIVDIHQEFINNIIILNLDNSGVEEYIKDQDTNVIQFKIGHIQSEYFRIPPKLYHLSRHVNYYNGKCSIEKLISTIELLVEKYSNLSSSESVSQYSMLIVYLYDKLIQFKNVTFNQVLTIHRLLEYNCIELKLELHHSFFYLNLKDSKLSKFIIDFIESSCGNINQIHFDTFSIQYIFSSSFDQILDKLTSQLFHSVLGEMKDKGGNCFFTTSMNSILKYCLEIKRTDLFFKHCQFIQNQIDLVNNGDVKGIVVTGFPVLTYINTTNNQPIPQKLKLIPIEMYDLQYPFPKYINTFNYSVKLFPLICSMDIENVVKFIEFSNIQYQLTIMFELYHQSLLKSRFDLIKILLQVYKLPIGCMNFSNIALDEKYDKYQESKLIIETNDQYKDPIEFEISRFNLFKNIFSNQFLKFVNSFFFNSRNRSSYNKFIKDPDSRNQILKEIFTDVKKVFDDKSRSIESLIGYGTFSAKIVDLLNQQMPQQQLGTPSEQKSFFEIYKSDQIQSIINSLFKEYESQRINEIKSTFNQNDNDNLFSNSFVYGNIEKCNLLLKHYPKHFKITKQMITATIQLHNIHIIKYYYKNTNSNLINSNFKNDEPDLILHLKKELSNNLDYKYDLNWL